MAEPTGTDIPDIKPVSDKLEVVSIDGDGLPSSAEKIWLSWIASSTRRGKLTLKFWKSDNELLEHQADSSTNIQVSKPKIDGIVSKVDKEEPRSSFPLSARETFKAALVHFGKKWYRRISFVWRHLMQIIGSFSKLWVSRLRQLYSYQLCIHTCNSFLFFRSLFFHANNRP